MKGLKLIILLNLISGCLWAQSSITYEPYQFISRSKDTVDTELGTIQVPENRTNPNSRMINIKFVKFKSTSSNPGYPIVYLAGGPGGSGIGAARGRRFELFMALSQFADVIALEQRGTGLSNDLPRCPEMARLDLMEPGTMDYYISNLSKTAGSCIEFWKGENVDITGYNTIENANDLEDLRKALGTEKLNLWGISYGTHLAFNYIKRYEDKVDKVILASLEGPDETIKLPSNTQAYLNTLVSYINKNEAAQKAYPDLLGLMKSVFDRLESSPVKSEFQNPRSGKKGEVMISKLDLQLVTSYFLVKNPEDAAKLPFLYHQMKQGDFSGVATYIAMVKSYAGMIDPMSFAMDAMSGISSERWEQVQKEADSALLGRTTNFPFPDIGLKVGFPMMPDSFRENPISGVNALFFSGTLDGRTYIPAAKKLVAGFKNGKHIIIEGAGHDLFLSTPKVKEIMLNFMEGKKVKSQTIDAGAPDFKLLN